MFKQVLKFFYIVSESRKKLLILLLMAALTSVLEAFGVGLIGPFIGIASDPSSIENIQFLRRIYKAFDFASGEQFIIVVGITTVFAFCLKSLALILTNSYTYKVTYDQKKTLVARMMSAYLKAPYTFFLDRNTSDIIQKISIETTTFCQEYMMPLLTAVVNAITIILLIALLASTNIYLLSAISFVVLLIFFVFGRLSSSFRKWGIARTQADSDMIRTVNHSLGGLKETRIIGCEAYFENQVVLFGQQWVNSVTLFHASKMVFPILVQTSLIVVIILFVCGSLYFPGQSQEEVTSVMAVFAAASLRLIPTINSFVNSVSSINNNGHVASIIYHDLKEIEDIERLRESQELEYLSNSGVAERFVESELVKQNISLRSNIELSGITYRYPGTSQDTIKDVSLSFIKGESIALIGKSGAGKTTLVDIILGLLKPQKGDIYVDGISIYSNLRCWQNLVGYIPQFIFLMDDTIERNIAYGVADKLIDHQRLHRVIDAAQLTNLVESLPDGVNTRLGERGVRLSGGQRQRIGIARALYHEREVLILDEATAALDNETERIVTESINALAGVKTLIIIAHRLSTIQQCDRVYELEDGRLKQAGSYREVVEGTV